MIYEYILPIIQPLIIEYEPPKARLILSVIGTTEILQVAVKLPSTVVALISTLPMVIAVTTPPLLTMATFELLLDQVTLLLSAFVGNTVAVSW
ncbi:hypothetical protein ES708_34778 [subsurface metagenome]